LVFLYHLLFLIDFLFYFMIFSPDTGMDFLLCLGSWVFSVLDIQISTFSYFWIGLVCDRSFLTYPHQGGLFPSFCLLSSIELPSIPVFYPPLFCFFFFSFLSSLLMKSALPLGNFLFLRADRFSCCGTPPLFLFFFTFFFFFFFFYRSNALPSCPPYILPELSISVPLGFSCTPTFSFSTFLASFHWCSPFFPFSVITVSWSFLHTFMSSGILNPPPWSPSIVSFDGFSFFFPISPSLPPRFQSPVQTLLFLVSHLWFHPLCFFIPLCWGSSPHFFFPLLNRNLFEHSFFIFAIPRGFYLVDKRYLPSPWLMISLFFPRSAVACLFFLT